MEMPAERIDVAFSIFDVECDLSITLESVLRFLKSGGSGSSSGSGMMTKEDDAEDEEKTQFRAAIIQVKKGASWVARQNKTSVDRVVRDAFVDRDADGVGKVTTGQFAQVVHLLGIEMTRTMTEALLRDLGVKSNSQPNDRCVNYKQLIHYCETM